MHQSLLGHSPSHPYLGSPSWSLCIIDPWDGWQWLIPVMDLDQHTDPWQFDTTYSCFPIWNYWSQICFCIFGFFGILCSGHINLHLFETFSGALGTYDFKNTMCVLHHIWVMGMKLCDWWCTVSTLVLLSISHTFVWENDDKISFLCVWAVSPISEYDLTLTSSTQFILH